MASERAEKWWEGVRSQVVHVKIPEIYGTCFDAGYTQGAADKEAEIRALREAIIQEVHRHWLFLKYERDNGGNYEHLNTRMVEAEYIEGRIRALLAGEPRIGPNVYKGEDGSTSTLHTSAGEPPAGYGQSRSMDKRLEVQGKPKANQP